MRAICKECRVVLGSKEFNGCLILERIDLVLAVVCYNIWCFEPMLRQSEKKKDAWRTKSTSSDVMVADECGP